jgi:hypothetical protein
MPTTNAAITEIHANPSGTLQDRRDNFDVTNTVDVSRMTAVREAVRQLFLGTYPEAAFDRLWLVFHDFERLFTGRFPHYHGCDTTYHDVQHTLDMTLAVARLIAGHELNAPPAEQLGVARMELCLIISLFHDSGYIRHQEHDAHVKNGAQFTRNHVTRSAEFLRNYLPSVGLEPSVEIAAKLVHFTGYELAIDDINVSDARDKRCGYILGTGDLLAQMADRCYLEKCRDRLYEEFVLGGVALPIDEDGIASVVYDSGEDLLRKTPMFFQSGAKVRLDETFHKVYRLIEGVCDGRNPYIAAINKNMRYLQCVINTNNWAGLRRMPPVYVAKEDVSDSMKLWVRELRESLLGDGSQQVA